VEIEKLRLIFSTLLASLIIVASTILLINNVIDKDTFLYLIFIALALFTNNLSLITKPRSSPKVSNKITILNLINYNSSIGLALTFTLLSIEYILSILGIVTFIFALMINIKQCLSG